ncbi:putative sarcosine oxidase [Talaromyces proteolyticus]|uniref:Sarcosine oxidase n=1 Tax=Talaromyces proteolyticus TaxID=1131652 RepID=A0AAD4KJ21_9EURO|nr:putative sarcosine oxidase [Talaromyces proteolyticus]KAH8691443.1 putative sarcosine oxidase [Talaromyces proteolyticus]
MSLSKDSSILIIGAGTFGTSTAFHLAKRGYTNIVCIDRHPWPSQDSAGYDLNKIIRTEYEEELYTELALEALNAWRQPMWNGIFYETGRITTTSGDPDAVQNLKESYENLCKAGAAKSIELIEGKEQIVKHCPQLAGAVGLEEWKGLWNREAGWAHARKALEKLAAESERMGVRFISGRRGTMTGLELDTNNMLLGVKVASGEILRAERYILSTGAASPGLLPDILSTQLWSKCWTLAHVALSEEEIAQWKGIPVIDNMELGFTFEPDPETKLMKICNAFPGYQCRQGEYTDLKTGKKTIFSIPRYASDYPEDGIPTEAADGIRRFIAAVMPQFSGRPLVEARVCWCTDSPDSHYLIDKHPRHENLLLATGDSGHAFKMLPIIGDYIADALEGSERGLKKQWSYGGRKEIRNVTRPGTEIKDIRDVLDPSRKGAKL